jgi:hypothetical protein
VNIVAAAPFSSWQVSEAGPAVSFIYTHHIITIIHSRDGYMACLLLMPPAAEGCAACCCCYPLQSNNNNNLSRRRFDFSRDLPPFLIHRDLHIMNVCKKCYINLYDVICTPGRVCQQADAHGQAQTNSTERAAI